MDKERDINLRLMEMLKHYFAGDKNAFAAYMKWSPQYFANLLRNKGIGIRPVTLLLEKFEDVNARWLITGEGDMLDDSILLKKVNVMLSASEYVSVMSDDEKVRYYEALSTGNAGLITEDQIAVWKIKKNRKNDMMKKIGDAMNESVVKGN